MQTQGEYDVNVELDVEADGQPSRNSRETRGMGPKDDVVGIDNILLIRYIVLPDQGRHCPFRKGEQDSESIEAFHLPIMELIFLQYNIT